MHLLMSKQYISEIRKLIISWHGLVHLHRQHYELLLDVECTICVVVVEVANEDAIYIKLKYTTIEVTVNDIQFPTIVLTLDMLQTLTGDAL